MKSTLTVFISLLYSVSYSQTLDSIVHCLNRSDSILYFEQKGKFEYIINDSGGVYKARFNGTTKYSIEYVENAAEARDQLILGKKNFYLRQKLDPLGLAFYKIKFKESYFYCFVGRAEAASGTGNQVFFYILVKQQGGHFGEAIFFDSRFGSVYNIGDFDASGNLEYLKMSFRKGGGKQGYVCHVNYIRNNSPVDSTKYINLERTEDGGYFYLKEYNWFANSQCLDGVKDKRIFDAY